MLTGSITVTNPINGMKWEAAIDKQEEFFKLKNSCFEEAGVSPFIGVVVPIRTDTCSHFKDDLFLPLTMMLNTDACNALGCKIIVYLGTIFLDLITLPIRLLTCIFRAIYNANYESTFGAYLKANCASELVYKNATQLNVEFKATFDQKPHSRQVFYQGESYLIQVPAPLSGNFTTRTSFF